MSNLFDSISLPPFKLKDTTSIPINQALIRIISSQFGTISQSVKVSLDKLQKLRDQLVNSTNPELIINSGTEYYNYVNALTQRVNLNSTVFQFSFSWSDSYKKVLPATSSLIYFETANVLYNVGVSYILQANSMFRNDIQAAIDSLKTASFVFNEIINITIGNEKQITLSDIRPETLKLLSQFCLFIVQYFYYQKSKQEHKSVAVQLKLGSGVHSLSLLTRDYLKAAKEFLPRSIHSVISMLLKISVSDVQLQMADYYATEELKYGEQIARIKNVISELDSISRLKELPKEYKSSCDGIIKVLKSDLNQHEKDNNEVYFQPIPDASDLRFSDPTVLAKPKPLSLMDNNPFRELLPPKIRSAFNDYLNRVQKVIADTKEITPKATKTGNEYLVKIKLNDLIQIVKYPQTVPSDIEKFAKDFSQNATLTKLKERIALVQQTVEKNEALMTEIKNRFDEEALKDNEGILQYRSYWTVPLTTNQRDKINGIREIESLISTGKRKDNDTLTKLKINGEMLQLLEEGVESLIQFFPTREETESALGVVDILEGELNEWENIITEREELLQQILSSADNQETKLIDELNATDNQDGVVQKYAKKLTELTSQMQQSFDKQQTLMKNIVRDQSELQIVLGVKAVELNTNIDKIYNAMKVANEIRDEINQSIAYHSSVYGKISKLQTEIFTFCDRHSFEVEELYKSLESARIKPLPMNAQQKHMPPPQRTSPQPQMPPPQRPMMASQPQMYQQPQRTSPQPQMPPPQRPMMASQPQMYQQPQMMPPQRPMMVSQPNPYATQQSNMYSSTPQRPNVMATSTQQPSVMYGSTQPVYSRGGYVAQPNPYVQPTRPGFVQPPGYPPQGYPMNRTPIPQQPQNVYPPQGYPQQYPQQYPGVPR